MPLIKVVRLEGRKELKRIADVLEELNRILGHFLELPEKEEFTIARIDEQEYPEEQDESVGIMD